MSSCCHANERLTLLSSLAKGSRAATVLLERSGPPFLLLRSGLRPRLGLWSTLPTRRPLVVNWTNVKVLELMVQDDRLLNIVVGELEQLVGPSVGAGKHAAQLSDRRRASGPGRRRRHEKETARRAEGGQNVAWISAGRGS